VLPTDREILELKLRAELDPTNVGALLDLATAYERAGLDDDAQRVYDDVLATDPGNLPARRGRFRAFRRRYHKLAATGDAYERAAIVHQVGELGDRFAVSWLVTLLDAAEPVVCQKAAEALGRLGDRAAVPGLLRLLRNDPACAWWQAAEALVAIRDPASVPPLLATLANGSPSARAAAAHALGLLGDPTAAEGLTRALAHDDAFLRRASAEALGELGSPGAVPALAAALDDPVPETREAVLASLGVLAGRRFRSGLFSAAEQQARRWWQTSGRFRHWGAGMPPRAALDARRRHHAVMNRRTLAVAGLTVGAALLALAGVALFFYLAGRRSSDRPAPAGRPPLVAESR